MTSAELERPVTAPRRRARDGWHHREPAAGGIVVDDGCDVRIGSVRVGAVARAALLHWLPLSHAELDLVDDGSFTDDPADAIACLLRPPTIWPLDDAVRARMLFRLDDLLDATRSAAIESYALSRIDRAHLGGLREAVRRIEGQLPVPEAPAATATIAAGCATLATDGERRRSVVARQLVRYAASGIVASRCARLLAAS
jgi:hypothetical protein